MRTLVSLAVLTLLGALVAMGQGGAAPMSFKHAGKAVPFQTVSCQSAGPDGADELSCFVDANGTLNIQLWGKPAKK